jgi:poly(ribitol-phosphate) beta-N-acetylglucosaminyltransferase
MTPPDVSVVVPVYNTMPYLTECLDSLVRQTIGHDRMQIVAVDDGSTDRSGTELDRYAARHPGLFTVVHQANSGGPAAPFNTGLDAATGRYVFFIGADDYLGDEALARMVTAADEWGSDVLLGPVTGVNSRHIYQDIFARTEPDLDLFDSVLPRSLANTKLFRRDLLRRHGIRYREDMRIASDLPFTLEACYRAGRISVITGYTCYYAVRRFSGTNVTYLSRHRLRVDTVVKIVDFVAGLIPAGKQRDAIMLRRFDHEIARLIEDDFLRLDQDTQAYVHSTLGRIVAEHLTGDVAAQLSAETRVRLALTRDGTLADLVAAIRQDAETGTPPTEIRDGRVYACYPGFGRLPDEVFDVTTAPEWPVKLDATAVTLAGDELTVTAVSAAPVNPSVSAEEIPGRVAADGTTVRVTFSVSELLRHSDATGQRFLVSAQPGDFDPALAPGRFQATGAAGAAPVRAPHLRARPAIRMKGARPHVIAPVVNEAGRLMISVVPLTARQVAARLRSRLG